MDNKNQNQVTVEYGQTEKKRGKGLAIVSLVFGIISLLTFFVTYVTVPCMLVSMVASVVALNKKTTYKEMVIAGWISSSLALVIMVAVAIFYAMFAKTNVAPSIIKF